jgi:hypothetical protein
MILKLFRFVADERNGNLGIDFEKEAGPELQIALEVSSLKVTGVS